MIDPKDVIKKYTVEELCATAEQYFHLVSDPTPLMSKPFSFLNETPEALQNLGLLLSGLQLGRTMKVLDFGAGTCWLSRVLTQLNCETICCDPSPTALDIGRRLFEEYPLIGTVVYKPTFLPFDGHRIDLPDESVDRILCFDAFHHVPNPAEVIREFGRVLKKGGIAGFSEPGQGHSRTPQSQYEMSNYCVLENDINVNEIFQFARTAGFTELSLKVVTDMEMSLSQHNLLFGQPGDAESLRSELWNRTHNTMHNRAIFFLHKGPLARDSRSHIGLAHVIRIDKTDYAVEAGQPLRLSVTITNTGEASWLHTNSQIFGIVRLATHLYDGDGKLLNIDFSRHALPVSVSPGETITMSIEENLPGPGRYRLAVDLVAEGVIWFENVGSTPIMVTAQVTSIS
jgi:SAM-dependent methyltransferase